MPNSAFSQANDGWYKPYVSIYGYEYARAVAIGDVDGDTLPDVVITTEDSSGAEIIAVYLQNTDGGLDKPAIYDLPSTNNRSLDIADIDGDGRNDVIVPCTASISVLYQNTNGILNNPVEVVTGWMFGYLRVADFNQDTFMDIASSRGNGVDVYFGGGGGFGAPEQYDFGFDPIDLQIGDLSDDGRTDIACIQSTGGTGSIAVLIQDGANAFNAAVTYDTTLDRNLGCAIGGLNLADDSSDDLCVAGSINSGNDAIDILVQNAGNTLTYDNSYSMGTPYPNGPVVITDTNQDGRDDVLVASSSSMTVFHQQSDGTMLNSEVYTLPYATWLSPHGMAVGDINNDSIDDLVFANYNSGVVILYGWDGSNAISLQYPSGEEFTMGDDISIRWDSIGAFTEVDLSYSLDGGASWNNIVTAETNDGRYDWTAPAAESDNFLIKVSSSLVGAEGYSMTPNTIIDDNISRITVTAPNGGNTIVAGTDYNIRWTTTGTVGNVNIYYSTNNGTDWIDLILDTTNDGNQTWNVPDEPSDECLIRIRDKDDETITDTSDSVFSILPAGSQAVTLTAPNGGESLVGGANYNITWEATNITQVVLQYSIDNGTNWENIATAQGSTGSFTWTVPSVNSTECLVRIRDSGDNNPTDVSDATFSISTIAGASITVLSPNGGEFFFIGKTHEITWQSTTAAVGDVQIQYSINNGGSWITIAGSTANDGSYDWVVPDTPSDQCLIRIREASDQNPSDTSDEVFSIAELGYTISLTSPQNGDTWQVGTKHDIKWVSGEKASNNVKLEYSTNNQTTWKTIISSTTNDGTYTWTVPNAPSTTCNVRISDVADTGLSNISYGHFSIVTDAPAPVISLNRTTLYYVWVKSSSAQTPMQTVTIDNLGAEELKWKAEVDGQDNDYDDETLWLKITNTTGTQSGQVGVYIEPLGLAVGTYDGAIKFTDANADNSPQSVQIILNVVAAGNDANPFGSFETPVNGSTVMSSIPVTGWVIDDVGIDKVTIWRNAVAGEGKGEVYIGDAVLVEGARPDVEQAYPSYPMSYQAGWGYMMLTNFLPNGGNGTYTIHAYAKDVGGHQVKLGSKTITCDNAHADQPFGAIDTPGQGGEASGTKFRNQGWVLTPQPNKIPVDGSTIRVYIDGVNIDTANYNIYRADIADLFPGYNNSNGAMAYLDFDTTAYKNGIHTIQWVVTDNGGNTDGIGSRYFTIQNTGYNRQSTGTISSKEITGKDHPQPAVKTGYNYAEIKKIPLDRYKIVEVKTGLSQKAQSKFLAPQKDGNIYIDIQQDERLEINLKLSRDMVHTGYIEINGQLRPLPPGSVLDGSRGIFYWQPGPASLGKYPLVFISKDSSGKTVKKRIQVEISPKFPLANN